MRILLFNWKDITNPEAGGAEVFIHEVAKRWVSSGHEVTLFCRSFRDAGSQERIDGIEVLREGNRLSVYGEARRWYARHGAGRFDAVVDVVNTRPFLTPRFVHDAPVVAIIFQLAREIWLHETPLALALAGRYVLERHWLRNYRQVPVVTISESSRASLESCGLQHLHVVPVGLQLPSNVSPAPRELQPTVAFVGRLAPNKRPGHALQAFELARKSLPNLQMWVIGGGALEGKLRRQHSETARFFGHVPETQKFDLLTRAHALLVTSVREGWGMVVSEAAAVGTPSIAYRVPGLQDSVPASGGVLVEPAPRAMARAINQILPKWVSSDFRVHPGGIDTWAETASKILAVIDKTPRPSGAIAATDAW